MLSANSKMKSWTKTRQSSTPFSQISQSDLIKEKKKYKTWLKLSFLRHLGEVTHSVKSRYSYNNYCSQNSCFQTGLHVSVWPWYLRLAFISQNGLHVSVWPSYLIHELQKVQNNPVRLRLQAKKRDHVIPLLCSLSWLPAHACIQYKSSVNWFDIVEGTCPPHFPEPLFPYIPTRNPPFVWPAHPVCSCHQGNNEQSLTF